MQISIAMATYNGAKYLDEQLQSFAQQERLPDELVVHDDRSTDGTIQILEQFALQAPFRVSISVNSESLGYIKNFESAVSECCGDLVFLSDQDDVWYSHKIARMEAYMEEHPDIMVGIADMEIGNENAVPSGATQLGNILALGSRSSWYGAGCATVFRRDWLSISLPFDQHVMPHDGWLTRLALALQTRGILHETLQCYRRHDSNVSRALSSLPRKVSKWDSFKAHGLSDASDGWRMERCRSLAVCARLRERREQVAALGLSHRLPGALESLQSHERALTNRIQAVSKPRLFRLPAIVRMSVRGEYQYFSGLRSIVKDIVRP